MTKRAVSRTYGQFLEELTDEMLDVVGEEFGGGLAGRVAKRGVHTATGRIRSEMEQQGRVVVEYASAIAREEENLDRYEREFIRTNPVYQRYDGDEERALRKHLLSHFRRVGEDLAPLVASDTDDFWLALREEYTREEAENLIDRHFNQAETFKRYRAGVFSSDTIGKRVISVVEEGERRLREKLFGRLDDVYAGDRGGA